MRRLRISTGIAAALLAAACAGPSGHGSAGHQAGLGGAAEVGTGRSGAGQSRADRSGAGQSRAGRSGAGQSRADRSGAGQSGAGRSGAGRRGMGWGGGSGTIAGRLLLEGGALRAGGRQPGERPIRGAVWFTAGGRRLATVRVGASGIFSVTLPPGRYAVSGSSPRHRGDQPRRPPPGPVRQGSPGDGAFRLRHQDHGHLHRPLSRAPGRAGALGALGVTDVPGYLRDRHLRRNWTVNAIAAETGQPQTWLPRHAGAR
jgi:hypothetical protein